MTTIDDHEHDRLREDLAGYVLGGLTPTEQLAVEAHLAECASCRAELAELDPLPVLLALAADAPAPASDAAAADLPTTDLPTTAPLGPPPAAATILAGPGPDALRPRRVRPRVLVAGAVVALALVAAFAVGLVVAAPSEPGYGPSVALQPVGTSHAAGTASVRAADHGTEVRLVLQDLPSATGTWYECIWWSASGHRWSAGTFRPGSSEETKVELLAAAALHPGWRLAILEHVAGRPAPTAVLQTSA